MIITINGAAFPILPPDMKPRKWLRNTEDPPPTEKMPWEEARRQRWYLTGKIVGFNCKMWGSTVICPTGILVPKTSNFLWRFSYQHVGFDQQNRD